MGEIPIRLEKIGELASRIDAQRMKNGKLQQMMKNYDVPTVDVYIELKLSLERIERREDQLLRKHNLKELAANNEKARKAKQKKVQRPPSKLTRKPTQFTTLPGKV